MTVEPRRPAWVEAALADRLPDPTILVLGGFLTSPPAYRPFAARLLERGAADVVVGGVWTPGLAPRGEARPRPDPHAVRPGAAGGVGPVG